MNIPYFRPSIGSEEIKAVTSCLESGWLTSGFKCIEFEKSFKSFLETSNYSLTVNSNTSGLHLALEALGIKEGDEVITSNLTFTATAEVIKHVGATPIIVDISPNNYCLDLKKVEKAISERTKCLIPVHFAGYPVDIQSINNLARKYSLNVIEDCAHSLPSRYLDNKIIGNSENTCVFSFYANKCITTGEGGMIVTPSEDLYKRMKIMRLHGIDRDVYDRFTNINASWFYDVVDAGYKYNLPDINASIGLEQLKKCKKLHSERLRIAKLYFEGLKNLEIQLPPYSNNITSHSWHIFSIKLNVNNEKINRDKLHIYLKKHGIGTSVHYRPLNLHSFWKNEIKNNQFKCEFKESEELYKNCLSLPIYPDLKNEEVGFIIKKIRDFFFAI